MNKSVCVLFFGLFCFLNVGSQELAVDPTLKILPAPASLPLLSVPKRGDVLSGIIWYEYGSERNKIFIGDKYFSLNEEVLSSGWLVHEIKEDLVVLKNIKTKKYKEVKVKGEIK